MIDSKVSILEACAVLEDAWVLKQSDGKIEEAKVLRESLLILLKMGDMNLSDLSEWQIHIRSTNMGKNLDPKSYFDPNYIIEKYFKK